MTTFAQLLKVKELEQKLQAEAAPQGLLHAFGIMPNLNISGSVVRVPAVFAGTCVDCTGNECETPSLTDTLLTQIEAKKLTEQLLEQIAIKNLTADLTAQIEAQEAIVKLTEELVAQLEAKNLVAVLKTQLQNKLNQAVLTEGLKAQVAQINLTQSLKEQVAANALVNVLDEIREEVIESAIEVSLTLGYMPFQDLSTTSDLLVYVIESKLEEEGYSSEDFTISQEYMIGLLEEIIEELIVEHGFNPKVEFVDNELVVSSLMA